MPSTNLLARSAGVSYLIVPQGIVALGMRLYGPLHKVGAHAS